MMTIIDGQFAPDGSLLVGVDRSLQYDRHVYWLEPYCVCEYVISREILMHAQGFDPIAYTRHLLARKIADAVRDRWAHYTTVETEQTSLLDRVIRYTAYEQPSYRNIEFWYLPMHRDRLRLTRLQDNVGLDPNAPVDTELVELLLRPLMYHDERVRGALCDGVLHVVVARGTTA